MGVKAAAQLAISRARRAANNLLRKQTSRLIPSGLSSWRHDAAPNLMVPRLSIACDGAEEKWSAHVFDLLGSGPRNVELVLDNPLSDLPSVWAGQYVRLATMVRRGYKPIDWQIDAKSGFRWSARVWYRDIPIGNNKGVDIKWPWELARLQHLPPMAGRIVDASSTMRTAIGEEIRSQIIDFVMQNPPMYGVNWVCAMDVGIRASNIALAVDIARAAGVCFDTEFLSLVTATLRDHGRFIVANLEWGSSLCSNHYLADVVGLLYIAAYLPASEEASNWLAFAGRETALQLRTQFYADGTNFEGSTCYHRLSAEMMVYGTSLMLHLAARRPQVLSIWCAGTSANYHPSPAAPALSVTTNAQGVSIPFSEDDRIRLSGMGRFMSAILQRNGAIPQIGDNDNGRFLRLQYGLDSYADLRSFSHVPNSVQSIFEGAPEDTLSPECRWLTSWVADGRLGVLPGNLQSADAAFASFPNFGLYVWNVGPLRITIRCGNVGQNGNGGHAHSDQLALTMDADGVPVFVDSGTGIYTPDPEIRNRFRSVNSHGAMGLPNMEPNEWLAGRWGLFAMTDRSHAKCLFSGPREFRANHQGYGFGVERHLRIEENRIEISDSSEVPADGLYSQLILSPDVSFQIEDQSCRIFVPLTDIEIILQVSGLLISHVCPFSPIYGVIAGSRLLRWPSGRASIEWRQNRQRNDAPESPAIGTIA